MTRIPLFSTIAASIILATSAVPLDNTATRSLVGRSPKSPTHSGILPSSSPAYLPDFPFHGVVPLNPVPTGPLDDNSDLDESSYPSPWEQPDVEDEEVQRAISAIDWDHVPDFPVRGEDGPGDYDYDEDPACWWTYTQCGTPKASYLPDDVKFCPNKGDFGLVKCLLFKKKNDRFF
jgi:hypothetical protein